jgi:hypothetical protein
MDNVQMIIELMSERDYEAAPRGCAAAFGGSMAGVGDEVDGAD